MKKVLCYLTIALLFLSTGCSKDDSTSNETTYTFIDDYGMPVPGVSDYCVFLSEYDASGSRVMTYKIDDPEVGKKYVYTSNKHSEKVKVKFQYKFGSTSYNKWVQQVWYLEEGKNIDIITDGETIVGNLEP